jgi:hypothetical protein
MLAILVAAQAFTPHAVEAARNIIILTVVAIMIFRRRLLSLLAYGIIIICTVVVVSGAVVLVQLMHGLRATPGQAGHALRHYLGRVGTFGATSPRSSSSSATLKPAPAGHGCVTR